MTDIKWLYNYFELYNKTIINDEVIKDLTDFKKIILKTNKRGNKTIFAGNGGSAAMSSHCAVDLTKNAKIKAINFNESDLITCFANDYGYESWIATALDFYANKGDLVVLISSSGSSLNIVNAAKKAKELDLKVVTFSGFDSSNKLKCIGDLNFWVNSKAYNIIEMTHHIWILAVVDLIIGDAEYPA